METAISQVRGLVVLCAANSWDTVKMMDRHLAEHLARLIPVLYVDPPVSPLTPLKYPQLASSLKGPRLREVAPCLLRFTPTVLPGPERPGMARVTEALVRRSLRNVVQRLDVRVKAVIAASCTVSTLGACNEELKVFWAQDDFASGAHLFGISAHRLQRGERRLAAAADVIIAANPVVAQSWRDRGYDPVLIPYGCDTSHFAGSDMAPVPASVHLTPPVAGFIGHLTDRIDIRLLEAVAKAGVSLLLVGPRHWTFEVSRLERLISLPNVQWVGEKPFDELPSYMRVIDVGLVPYADSGFNRGSFPLKTLEYLAAGRAVVATDLPAMRWLATSLITRASEPDSFARHVVAALAVRRTAAQVTERQAFSARHSWEVRSREFLHTLGLGSTPAARPDRGGLLE